MRRSRFGILTNLVVRALSLTTSGRVVLKSVASEADAREWLTAQRRTYLARKATDT